MRKQTFQPVPAGLTAIERQEHYVHDLERQLALAEDEARAAKIRNEDLYGDWLTARSRLNQLRGEAS